VSYQWPEPAASLLEELEAQLRDLLGPNLVGMYVYGSLAFGCYNPARSDIDVLVITRRRLAPETRGPLSSLLHELSDRLEISFLSRADVDPWRYPTPFDLHFSNEGEKHDGAAVCFATEIGNVRARGVALVGPPPEKVFPEVPDEDFLDSIERDLVWAGDHVQERPGYAVLNACRVLAYRSERRVMSKAEAAHWGVRELPRQFRHLIGAAGAHYAGDPEEELDLDEVAAFLLWVEEVV
jgi:predicted nucleotidyltransferase